MSREEEAYREGFEDGNAQAVRYEWGGGFSSAGYCWERSDAKAESEKARFREHLEWASKEVASWPEWKRGLLDEAGKSTGESRKP